VSALASDLADCVEAPVRNRVFELLEHPALPDDAVALEMLRVNIAGASPAQLGEEVDVAGRTVARIEDGCGCHPRVANKLADRFALAVSELFGSGPGDKLQARTVAELRAAMAREHR
jgi:DNA-binding XRE family transcriptional regulator